MKKSVILSIIGLAAGMASSYGQGYISLDSYSSNGSHQANGPIFTLGTVGGPGLGSAYTAGIYFVTGSPAITDPAGTGIPNAALALATGNGSTIGFAGANAFSTPGYFSSPASWNSGAAVGGTITLEIVAYTGSSYASSASRLHSAPFTMTTVAGTSPTSSYVTDAAGWLSQAGTLVVPVPEPTTLALAGLGGLASLVALRRKQA